MAIRDHDELDVYRMAFRAAMQIFDESKVFPKEETNSLVGTIRVREHWGGLA